MHTITLFEVFIFLATTSLIVPLTSRFGFGSILGYLAAGILIGPFGVGLISNAESIMHFAEFGVVMMLFLIGLELEPKKLWHMRKSILGLGGLQIVGTTLALTTIGLTLGYDWRLSITVSMALSLSSTALVMQILHEKKMIRTSTGKSAFSILLMQDIAVIPILVIIPLLATTAAHTNVQDHASMIDHLPPAVQALIMATTIATLIIAGQKLSPRLFSMVARAELREVFTAMALAIVTGITLLMHAIGLSAALGAFIAGVVLANSEYRRSLETDIEPFKGLLLGLFFISVGMGINFTTLTDNPARVATILAILIPVKAAIIYSLSHLFRHTKKDNLSLTVLLSQGGEFAFVLFAQAHSLHILNTSDKELLTLAVAISIAMTPLVLWAINKMIMPRFATPKDTNYDTMDDMETPNEIILAGFGRFGQIIGRMLMANGEKVTVLENNPDQITLIRKFGFKAYYGDSARLDILKNAGAKDAKMIIIALNNPDTALEIVDMVKQEFPHLEIYARARNRRHAYELCKRGITYFKRDTFESALLMAEEILTARGMSHQTAARRAKKFRDFDEQKMREAFEFYEDEAKLISFAHTTTRELNDILSGDEEEKE